MYHLAIECSGIRGSVASFDGENLLTGLTLPEESSSVQSLAPSLVTLLNALNGPPHQSPQPPASPVGPSAKMPAAGEVRPKFLSVTIGPGSFTSLRVGLATTKMLAYAWNIPIVAVCSLQTIATAAIAKPLEPTETTAQPVRVVAVMNAYRGQVFAASWLWDTVKLCPLAAPQVLDADRWCSAPYSSLQFLPSAAAIDPPPPAPGSARLRRPILVSGPSLDSYLPQLSDQAGGPVALSPQSIWEPQAAVVGQIGWQMFQRGEVTTAAALAANYIRSSAAEEKK